MKREKGQAYVLPCSTQALLLSASGHGNCVQMCVQGGHAWSPWGRATNTPPHPELSTQVPS